MEPLKVKVVKDHQVDKVYPWVGAFKNGNIATELVVLFTAPNAGVCINVPPGLQEIKEKIGQVSNDWDESHYIPTEITLSSL